VSRRPGRRGPPRGRAPLPASRPGPVDGLLARAVAVGGRRPDQRPVPGPVERLLGLDHPVHQTQAVGLLGVDLAAGEDRSLARAGPIRRPSRWVPPPPGMMPSRISGWPKRRPVLPPGGHRPGPAPHPPPRAYPLTAATVGTGRLARASRAPRNAAPTRAARSEDGRAEAGSMNSFDVGSGGKDPRARPRPRRRRRIGGQRGHLLRQLGEQARGQGIHLGRSSRTRATPSGRRSTVTKRSGRSDQPPVEQ